LSKIGSMDTNPNTIIDALGGTSEVAEMCKLTTGAVSQWRRKGIPKPWVRFFQERRPDLFGLPTRGRRASSKKAA